MKPLGTVINRWLGEFHISQQKSPCPVTWGGLPDRKRMEAEKVRLLPTSKHQEILPFTNTRANNRDAVSKHLHCVLDSFTSLSLEDFLPFPFIES